VAERGDRFLTATSSARATRDYVRTFPIVGNVRVGASVLQTPGGVQSELSKVNSEIEGFGTEVENVARNLGAPVINVPHVDLVDAAKHAIAPWLDANGKSPAWEQIKAQTAQAGTPKAVADQPLVHFYNDGWLPFVTGWRSWYHDHDGWFHNLWWNEAPNAEGFQRKLLDLRATARKLGMKIMSPDPDIEGMSMFDPRRGGISDLLDSLGKAGKYALYGVLGLAGTFGVVEIVKAAKGK
jgi:hypothetical protein